MEPQDIHMRMLFVLIADYGAGQQSSRHIGHQAFDWIKNHENINSLQCFSNVSRGIIFL